MSSRVVIPTRAEADVRGLSVVTLHGDYESSCGYCTPDRFPGEKYGSFGAEALQLTCVDYQALIDHGWRRSGTFLYRPRNHESCCPNYTIRLDVTKFVADKHQNALLRRVNRFLNGERPPLRSGASGASESKPSVVSTPALDEVRGALQGLLRAVVDRWIAEHAAEEATRTAFAARAFPAHEDGGQVPLMRVLRSGGAEWASGAAFALTAAAKAVLGASFTDSPRAVAESLVRGIQTSGAESELVEASAGGAGFVNITIPASSPLAVRWAEAVREEEAAAEAGAGLRSGAKGRGKGGKGLPGAVLAEDDGFAAGGGGGSTADADSDGEADAADSGVPLAKHTLRVVMEPSSFDPEAFALYKKYQIAVHKDKPEELTRKKYESFLVTSPLTPATARGPFASPADACGKDDAATGMKSGGVEGSIGSKMKHSKTGEAARAGVRARPALVAQLARMGFSEAIATTALELTDNNVEAALSRVLDAREALAAGVDPAEALQSPAKRALLRCLEGQKRAWNEGEGPGAGLSLWADHGSHNAGDSTASSSSSSSPSSSSSSSPSSSSSSSSSSSTSSSSSSSSIEPTAFPGFRKGAVAVCVGDSASEGGCDLSLGYGSFHQKYYLDDRLVAVAVIDVLPECLSSVYVFYDPEETRLELGRYTALREIQWVQRAMRFSPRLRWYYMGYYVHQCSKMTYKAGYRPSDLLCPVNALWTPLESALPRLHRAKYCPFVDVAVVERVARERRERKEAEEVAERMPIVLLRSGDEVVLRELTARGQEIMRPLMVQFARLCGAELASRLVLGAR